ncbi:MAG TPA: hypothetical protein VFZ01_04140 [Geminicoccaceae bacterium]
MALAQLPIQVLPRLPVPQFDAADLAWEQASETAVRAYRAGGVEGALLRWQRGLTIGRERFEPGDPRLATSLTNCAFALRRQGEAFQSRRHFALAEEVFAQSWRWIGRMSPAGAPGERYDEAALESFAQLVGSLRSAARAIEARDELPIGRLEQWRVERSVRGSDVRKLLGASLLLISRPARAAD